MACASRLDSLLDVQPVCSGVRLIASAVFTLPSIAPTTSNPIAYLTVHSQATTRVELLSCPGIEQERAHVPDLRSAAGGRAFRPPDPGREKAPWSIGIPTSHGIRGFLGRGLGDEVRGERGEGVPLPPLPFPL